MKSVFEYINYRWNAKKRHGVHSPFVYDLSDKCFRIVPDPEFSLDLERIDRKLRVDDRVINVLDAGAGSKFFGTERKVRDIYRISSSKGSNGLLLYRLARHLKPARILEFGTSLGLGTVCLSHGNPNAAIITIEACPETLTMAKEVFEFSNRKNIQCVNSTFQDFLENYSGERFDLVFIDGHHDGQALLNYLNDLEKFTHDETLFVLDDIRWSNSMRAAFSKLIMNKKYHVSIDLFRTGLLLKRPHQVKEHFILRS